MGKCPYRFHEKTLLLLFPFFSYLPGNYSQQHFGIHIFRVRLVSSNYFRLNKWNYLSSAGLNEAFRTGMVGKLFVIISMSSHPLSLSLSPYFLRQLTNSPGIIVNLSVGNSGRLFLFIKRIPRPERTVNEFSGVHGPFSAGARRTPRGVAVPCLLPRLPHESIRTTCRTRLLPNQRIILRKKRKEGRK